MNPLMQISEVSVKVCFVGSPRQSINTGGGITLEREERPSRGPHPAQASAGATLVRWHRAGFRRYWRWKSRPLGGRPQVEAELRALIRRISVDNPLWGAPRIHGELLKLGFGVAQSSVAKYMVKRPRPPSQRWRTFLSAETLSGSTSQ
jgi:hypothetical protein